MKYSYKNPWYKENQHYGPEFYQTDIEPKKCGRALIFHRIKDCWDVVREGVCIAQRTGFEGARLMALDVDKLDSPTYQDVRDIQTGRVTLL